MLEHSPHLELKEAVHSDSIGRIRADAIDALFLTNEETRRDKIKILGSDFGGFLRRGYVANGDIFLDVNYDGHLRVIRVCTVPKAYMDVGQYSFEL